MVKQLVDERREWIRAKRILSIEFRIVKTGRKNTNKGWFLSTTEDMSVRGLAFYTEQEYNIGDVLEVHVVMSGVLDIFHGTGRIKRVERKKTGSCSLVAVELIEAKKNARRRPRGGTFRNSSKTLTRKRI